VCCVDVRSRRSLLQFVVDDNDVLGIGRDSEFKGLNREYGKSGEVPRKVPEVETVYIPKLINLEIELQGVGNGICIISKRNKLGDSSEEEDYK
jgi:hypothetical protein